MAASLCAAACGHTAPDAVTCTSAGEHCMHSACPACAAEGQEEILLGESVLPGGAEVFLPGFEGFTECSTCKSWECEPCYEDGGSLSCGCASATPSPAEGACLAPTLPATSFGAIAALLCAESAALERWRSA